MGLAPSEFWSLSIPEVQLQLKGAKQRLDDWYELGLFVAWHVASWMKLQKMPTWKSVRQDLKASSEAPISTSAPTLPQRQHWQELKGIMAAHRQGLANPMPDKKPRARSAPAKKSEARRA